MKIKRKNWVLEIGYNDEYDDYRFRFCWGGQAKERAVNGLYPWAYTFIVGYWWGRTRKLPRPFIRFRLA